MKMTFSNWLTILRGAASIAFIPLIIIDNQLVRLFALFAFTIAAITDYYDGRLARLLKDQSDFGVIADPIADKLLTGICLISCSVLMPEVVPPWMTGVILLREIGITVWRFVLLSRGRVLAADRMGKWKTGLQMTVIPYTLLLIALFSDEQGRGWRRAIDAQAWGSWPFEVGFYLALGTTFLTVYSGLNYLGSQRGVSSETGGSASA